MPSNLLRGKRNSKKNKSLRKIKRRSSKRYNKKGGSMFDWKHRGLKEVSEEKYNKYVEENEGGVKDGGKFYIPSMMGRWGKNIRESPRKVSEWGKKAYKDVRENKVWSDMKQGALDFKKNIGKKLTGMREGLKENLGKMMNGFTNLFKKADKKAQKIEDRFSRQKSEIKATLSRMTKLNRCLKDTILGKSEDGSGVHEDIIASLEKNNKKLFTRIKKFLSWKGESDKYDKTTRHSGLDGFVKTLVTKIYDCTDNDAKPSDPNIEAKVDNIIRSLEQLSKEMDAEEKSKKAKEAADYELRKAAIEAKIDNANLDDAKKVQAINEKNAARELQKRKEAAQKKVEKLEKEETDLDKKMKDEADTAKKAKLNEQLNAKKEETKKARAELGNVNVKTMIDANKAAEADLEQQKKDLLNKQKAKEDKIKKNQEMGLANANMERNVQAVDENMKKKQKEELEKLDMKNVQGVKADSPILGVSENKQITGLDTDSIDEKLMPIKEGSIQPPPNVKGVKKGGESCLLDEECEENLKCVNKKCAEPTTGTQPAPATEGQRAGAYHTERMNQLRFYFDLKKYQFGGSTAATEGTPTVEVKTETGDGNTVNKLVNDIEGLTKELDENLGIESKDKLMKQIVDTLRDKRKESDAQASDLGMYDEIIARVVDELKNSSKFILNLQLKGIIESHRKLSILNKIKKYVGDANLQLHKLVYGAKTKNWKNKYNIFKDRSHSFAKKALGYTSEKLENLVKLNKEAAKKKADLDEVNDLNENNEQEEKQKGGSKSFTQTLNELRKLNKKLIKDYNQYGGLMKKNKRSLNKSRKRSQKSRKRRR